MGVDVSHLELDTAIAAYLVDPAGDQYLLEDLALRYAGIELRAPDAPPAGQLDLERRGRRTADEEAGRRAAAVARLVEPLGAALSARGLSPLYDEIERPLVRVLARMEEVGVRVDEDELRRLAKRAGRGGPPARGRDPGAGRRAVPRQLDQAAAGDPLRQARAWRPRSRPRPGSPPTPSRWRSCGVSTRSSSRCCGTGRSRSCARPTATRCWPRWPPDGRIHATFNQTVARTGRLSSDQPNLHNIPIRSDEGRRFRRCFIPAEGCRFLVADYNQIELRVIAHLAEDPGLIEAFRAGTDIHNVTASRIFGVDPADVTIAMRSKAKMVSYGLAYGMESYGLAQRLAIPVDEAAEILEAYFEAFPNVRAYMDRVVAEARSRGYTETLFGRRRQIPELQSGNYRIRQAGERQAMNAGIQGLAADIFKVALVRLDTPPGRTGLASRLVLQVHDEVILEVPPDEEERAAAIGRWSAMAGAADAAGAAGRQPVVGCDLGRRQVRLGRGGGRRRRRGRRGVRAARTGRRRHDRGPRQRVRAVVAACTRRPAVPAVARRRPSSGPVVPGGGGG